MDIKYALSHHFSRLTSFCQQTYGTVPMVPFREDIDKRLIISAPNDDDEVAWQLQEITTAPEWAAIEHILGFRILDELREYYSTYLFCSLNGNFGDAQLYFEPIISEETVAETIIAQHQDAMNCFPDKHCFLIGNASIAENDSYGIFVDGDSGKVFCYEMESNDYILLTYSIVQLIDKMEAFD